MSASPGRAPFYLGIDLGGTNIKSGVVDDSGRVLSSVSRPTDVDEGPEAGIDHLAEAGHNALKEAGLAWDAIAGVGLGSPGTMDLEAGLLLDPPNLRGWENLPIRDLLSRRLGKKVIFQNDGNAAAYGEYWIGAGQGVRSLVMFTLGTGIGGGVVIDGEILEGRHSHGAEYGHIIVEMDGGRVCSCGQKGHLEAYASATAMVKRAHEVLAGDASASALRKVVPHDLDSRLIAESAAAGDALAVHLMNETARYLAVGAVSMMHTIDPDLVLFGGGMTNAGDPLLEEIRRNIRRMAFPIPAAKTRIEFARLGGEAGFVGAAGWARAVVSRTS